MENTFEQDLLSFDFPPPPDLDAIREREDKRVDILNELVKHLLELQLKNTPGFKPDKENPLKGKTNFVGGLSSYFQNEMMKYYQKEQEKKVRSSQGARAYDDILGRINEQQTELDKQNAKKEFIKNFVKDLIPGV